MNGFTANPGQLTQYNPPAIVMNSTPPQGSVILVGNRNKPDVPAAFQRLKNWIEHRNVRVSGTLDRDAAPIVANSNDRIVVLGGDGTILATAGQMGAHQSPIVGVNMGKLGYLAEYSVEDFQQHFDRILSDPSLVSERMMLQVEVHVNGSEVRHGWACNDCVVHAGQPFRMVELSLRLDGQDVTHIAGDGLIIATPTGSTAHNLSSGGPILQPDVRAIIITPICPHSLTHKPVVVGPDATVEILSIRSNEGTTAVIDGQQSIPLPAKSRILIRRAGDPFKLVRHPDRPAWKTLIRKLAWGTPPTR